MSEHDPDATVLSGIERQLERSSVYAQTALGRAGLRIHEIERVLYGMLDVLFAKGVISSAEMTEASEKVHDELIARGDLPERLVALRGESSDQPVTAQVDCAARMHVCRAVCCKLDFALSAPEVEGGRVRWDLGRPYHIRHDEDGYCHHNKRSTCECGVYHDRPAICRTYSCAGDARIWKDFERMELNTEWIDRNLSSPRRPRMLRVLMQRDG